MWKLAGEIGTTGLAISGSVNSWTLVPGVVTVNQASFLADISIDTPSDSQLAFDGDFDLMGHECRHRGSPEQVRRVPERFVDGWAAVCRHGHRGIHV